MGGMNGGCGRRGVFGKGLKGLPGEGKPGLGGGEKPGKGIDILFPPNGDGLGAGSGVGFA